MAPSIFIFCFFFLFLHFGRCCSSRCLHAKFVLVCLSACQLACCMVLGGICFSAPLPSSQSRPFRIGNSNSKSPSRNLDTHPVRTLDALRVRELDISQGFLNLPTGNAQPPKGFPSWRVLIFSIVDVLRIAHKQQMKSRRARVKLGLN